MRKMKAALLLLLLSCLGAGVCVDLDTVIERLEEKVAGAQVILM